MNFSKYERSEITRSIPRGRGEGEGKGGTLHALAGHPAEEFEIRSEESDNLSRTPVFTAPGLILFGPENSLLACNSEAVRILAYPSTSLNSRKIHSLLLSKVQMENRTAEHAERHVGEFLSGRRRYLCSRYVLEMHGPKELHTTAVLLDRVGNVDVTMHELCTRFHLTNRERQAVGFLVRGMTSKEIAVEMGISPNTVKSFLRLVMTKAGVSTRAGLIGRVAGISLQPVPVTKRTPPQRYRWSSE